MDKKAFIKALTLSVVVIALWMLWQTWYERNHPHPQPQQSAITNPGPGAETSPATNAATPSTMTASEAGNANTQPASTQSANTLTVQGPSLPNSGDVAIGSAIENDPNYAMQIRFAEKPTVARPEAMVTGDGLAYVMLNQFYGPRKNRNDKSIYE